MIQKIDKIINPCMCDTGKTSLSSAFAHITYENGNLSITGVIGPLPSGNCIGAAGQCVDKMRKGRPTKDWNRIMLDKFCGIWERWHLNDMRPYCIHQKELGWDKIALEKVELYHYKLTREAVIKKREAEHAALDALRKGIAFTPTKEQHKYASLAYSITVPEKIIGEWAEIYQPDKSNSIHPFVENEKLGWLKPEEHPRGILGKSCPVCGYKYGTAWLKEEIPSDVIDWLFSLPDSKIEPAWI